MTASPLHRVDTTLASAGTGKTTALVGLLARHLRDGVAPERILAATFTRKAAEELVERTRACLVAEGREDDATALLGMRIGTINAVCGRLVEEFAFELGRPPGGEVVSEESAALLFVAAADDAMARFAPALNVLGERFGLAEQKTGWRDQVRRVVELARANGLDAAGLGRSAERSTEILLALLPPPDPGVPEAALDDALRAEVQAALRRMADVTLKVTSGEAASAVRVAASLFERGEPLPWPLWAKLSKPKAAKSDAALFARVERVACSHPGHPALRRDLTAYLRLVFDCATDALAAYQSYKAERGLLDFTDQEMLTLEILRRPDTRERLREAVEVVLLDEVQDASPLQVAIFTELARVAARSTWVGDPKQAIYGFRDTDANLTLAAVRGIAAETGGASGVLATSWRSRPGLCAFVNDAFLPAFERMGLPREVSRFEGSAFDDGGFAAPPLTSWHLTGANRAEQAASLAAGVAAALADPSSWPVRAGPGDLPRGPRPSDIAVLCRGNGDVEAVASALSGLGIPVAVGRGDLFSAPEIELVLGALRWTADRGDRLAGAEVARLVGGGVEPRAWLDALGAGDPDAALRALVPFAATLDDLRERQSGMTPCETVDAVILATGVVDLVCRWGDAGARLHALEAFRGVARSFEEECASLRLAATLGGFVSWARTRVVPRPRSAGDAVQVMTYHKAKGLEWPVVVLAQLENGPRPRLFTPAVEVAGNLDWREPLARRWIRFWPWPYGAQGKGVHLDAAAAASEVGRRAAREARDEAVRLLYVGTTRARDHLVFARNARPGAWLRTLDTGSEPHVALPVTDGRPVMAGGAAHPARFQLIGPAAPAPARPAERLFLGAERPRVVHRPLRLRPSGMVGAGTFAALARTDLGGRLPIVGAPEMSLLGQAVHAFLAVDRADAEPHRRIARARLVLDRWDVAGHLDPAALVEAADRLWRFLDGRFPGACLRREVPVFAPVASQAVAGRIDLLVQWADRFAIVDHKSFPGREAAWSSKAVGVAPQLAVYARAVGTATGYVCEGLLVHMPLVGALVEVGAVVGVGAETVAGR